MIKNTLGLIIFIVILGTDIVGVCDYANWQEKRSEHFIIYYQDKSLKEEFINKVINYAENYYNQIAQNLGFMRYDFWLWENRAKIYIYQDQNTYMRETGQPAWSVGASSYREKIIKTFPLAAGFFDSLLPHELGHIIFREFVGFGNNVPLWLDEGIATYQEEAKRWGSKVEVKGAIKNNKFIPLDELTGINANALRGLENVNLFYSESVAIVDFLVTRFGSESFSAFCRTLREGKSLEEAIARNYPYKNLIDLNWSWRYYLENE